MHALLPIRPVNIICYINVRCLTLAIHRYGIPGPVVKADIIEVNLAHALKEISNFMIKIVTGEPGQCLRVGIRCSIEGKRQGSRTYRWPIEATITTRELNESVDESIRHCFSS
jgi:hypothetical protein